MIRFDQTEQPYESHTGIEVIDALDDPENGSGRMFTRYAEHTKPSVPTMTIDYTGNVGIE
jgi:hypothetical protein